MRLRGVTEYQLEILQAVRESASQGHDIDLDQLLDSLSWKPTKQSLQFSIRALIAKRMIVKTGMQVRRGRKRVCFCLDLEGKAVFDPRSPTARTGDRDLDPGVIDHLLSSCGDG